jgi:hypothetical protein
MPLTEIKIKNTKPADKQYKLTDSEGMYLLIHPNGGKYWRLKYQFNGKEKTLAFGTYPDISLSEAREKRREAKKQLQQGLDPSHEKKLKKLTQRIDSENNFESIAREWHKKKSGNLTTRHSKYVIRRLEVDIFPFIGFRPISKITAPELLSVVQKIEKRGAIDIAHRALQTSSQIFRYAIATSQQVERNMTLLLLLEALSRLEKRKIIPDSKKENYLNF